MKKEKNEEDIIRGRIFEIILYNADGPKFFDYLLKLENLCIDNNYSYYYITHDKDTYSQEDYEKYLEKHKEEPKWKIGDLKEVHTHYLIYTNESTTTLDHIAKECELEKRFIEKKNYLTSSIKYLVHSSTFSQEKARYDWHDIITNNSVKVNKVFENLDENTYMYDLVHFIDSQEIILYRDFVDYILKNNLWSYYRRSASILKMLIDEHNNKIKASW